MFHFLLYSAILNFIKFHIHMAREGQEREEAFVSIFYACEYHVTRSGSDIITLPRVSQVLPSPILLCTIWLNTYVSMQGQQMNEYARVSHQNNELKKNLASLQ